MAGPAGDATGGPTWETETSCAPVLQEMRTVPCREEPVFAVALKRAVPNPLDEPPDTTSRNGDDEAADHAQPAAVVTVTGNPPAIDESATVVGDTE